MGRIQTNIGLITGMPIGDTVDSLMQIEGRPRDMLVERTETFQQEHTATAELWAMLLSVQYLSNNLGQEELFERREATSSNPDVLTANVTGTPPMGTYQFTPLRTVQAHQLLSSGFKSDTESLGGGQLTFRFGDHVQRTASLDLFGGGQGVQRGQIRITDRAGVRAVVDLSTVQTVDDVLEAINANTAIDVMAVAAGDGIRLVDYTGQTVSNLKVQEVGGGTTAASLGLAGIDVAADVADGEDMIWLGNDVDLEELNDGMGISSSPVSEIGFTLRDGTVGEINFSGEEDTLGDVLEVFNSAAPGNLRVEMAPDGDRLTVIDLTEGSGKFELTPKFGLSTLSDLALWGMEASNGVITGNRVLGGAKTVLLSSLNGGNGFGQLGALELTDRNGVSDTVSLAGAETLEDVIDTINAADVGIVARVNQARNGFELADSTGASASHLIVADADGFATAEKLGIAIDADVTAVNSGDLHLQVIGVNTKLDDLNGGAGVTRGQLRIFDTKGNSALLDLRNDDIQTVGDVISAINFVWSSSLDSPGLSAEINDTGDGIRLVDNAGGPAIMRVEEYGGTIAQDLHLLGEAKQVDLDLDGTGTLSPAWVIDGSTTYTIELDDAAVPVDEQTALDGLNEGAGIELGTFAIVDSASNAATLDLTDGEYLTIGDVIEAINGLSVAVEARINKTGDGLLIIDKADGDGKLRIFEGNSTTAADLGLMQEMTEDRIDGQTVQVIDWSMDHGVRSLEDLRREINELDAGVSAMTFVDGSSRPFRLSMISDRPGRAGELVVDTSQLGLSFQETVRARDALLVFGEPKMASAGVLASSSTNSFRGVLSGVTLEVHQASDTPVMLSIEASDDDLVANVQALVENYNKFREKLLEVTAYDVETDTKSLLTADATALRLDVDLSNLLSGRFLGVGTIQSLAEVGISLKQDGTLDFDSTRLQDRFADDRESVKRFFSAEEFGVSQRFDKLFETLSTEETSLLANRLKTLERKIDHNQRRIDFLNERLERKQYQLFLEFYRMEMAIGKLQSNLSAIETIRPFATLSSSWD